MNTPGFRAVREVLEECLSYRNPPTELLNELGRRMHALQAELAPTIFDMLMRSKLFNPFDL